ncbi:hypothetical protein HK100_007817, partial [Physocladia obscura]
HIRGIFDFFSGSSNEHHGRVYAENGKHANLGHEVLAGAAGFEALRLIEQKHAEALGEKPKYSFFKELLAGFAAAEVDKIVETHSLRERGFDDAKINQLKADAIKQAHDGFDSHYGAI